MNKRISLNGEWRLRSFGKAPAGVDVSQAEIKATVPGTVHTDLLKEGIIPDPFYRDNESKVQWIEKVDWEYSREFHLNEGEVSSPLIYLTFEGIDTVADVYFNNKCILRTANMFVTHRVRIEKIARAGENSLRVIIHSPTKYAEAQERKHGKIFAELDTYRVHIRKAQYSFGWDWGPRLATSGIWKSVYLDFVNDALIEQPRLSTLDVRGKKVDALLAANLTFPPGYSASGKRLHLTFSGNQYPITLSMPKGEVLKKKLRLTDVDLWWTHDLGSPKLYEVKMEIVGVDGEVLSTCSFTTGFKVVKLIRDRDKNGESFIFELNQRKIFARGADWIPSDSFLPRLKADDYRTLVVAAREAGMNMLRVWGGGVYEDEEFYKACDEYGILVWQDFMFACASYPDYRKFVNEVEIEAIQNVQRISRHPCVAIFCGNNESEWTWKTKTGQPVDEMPGTLLFKRKLREIVGRISPEIPYWRSSPFGGIDPDSQDEGNHHQWEVWSGFKPPSAYKNNRARFVTEFGFQSPPTLATIKEFTEVQDQDMQSRVMRLHNKQVEGTERLFRFAAGEVRIAGNFEDVVLQMQLVQAKAIKTGVEHWRKRKWKTSGTLFWQLNDCWPVSSWSAIDHRKRPKALYYWAKKFYKPMKLVMEQRNDLVEIYFVNDILTPLECEVRIFAMDISGNVFKKQSKNVRARGNSASLVDTIDASGFRKDETVIHADVVGLRDGAMIDEDDAILVPWLDFKFQLPRLEINASDGNEGHLISLRSDKFLQGVYLPLDEFVGDLSDNFFSLQPNKEKTILYKGNSSLSSLRPRFPLISSIDSV